MNGSIVKGGFSACSVYTLLNTVDVLAPLELILDDRMAFGMFIILVVPAVEEKMKLIMDGTNPFLVGYGFQLTEFVFYETILGVNTTLNILGVIVYFRWVIPLHYIFTVQTYDFGLTWGYTAHAVYNLLVFLNISMTWLIMYAVVNAIFTIGVKNVKKI